MSPDDDQGFEDAAAAVKILESSEESLKRGEEYALAQLSPIQEFRSKVASIYDRIREARLKLGKVLKTRKEEIKRNAIQKGRMEFAKHKTALEKEIAPYFLQMNEPDFVGATKNLRTLASFRDAIDTTLANGKIEADRVAKEMREKLAEYKTIARDCEFLFADLQSILIKPLEDFRNAIKLRIDEHDKREKEREEKKIEESPIPERPFIREPSSVSIEQAGPHVKVSLESMVILCEEIAQGHVPENVISLNPKELINWISKNDIKNVPGLNITRE